jgi:hypothetical protein
MGLEVNSKVARQKCGFLALRGSFVSIQLFVKVSRI